MHGPFPNRCHESHLYTMPIPGKYIPELYVLINVQLGFRDGINSSWKQEPGSKTKTDNLSYERT